MMGESGMILRLERSSIHDGEGLRTVVFFKGCPLSCAWCSTPESQSPEIEKGEGYSYGQRMTVAEVMAEIGKDEVFFFHSGGGVTLSGGEPLAQADFAAALLKEARRLNIDTALESSLALPWREVAKALPDLNTLFADIKLMNPERHRFWCGQDNQLILENLRRVAAWDWPLTLVARMPLVPGVNDDDENILATARFCRELGRVERLELLPYHRLGLHTYAKLGREYLLPQVKPPSPDYLAERRRLAGQYIPCV